VIFGPSNAKIYLALGATDMRKAIDGLAVLVAGKMHLDPLSGSLYVFCNRSRTIIKALYWDRNGFCLWQKRLEKHSFKWPSSKSEAMQISARQLAWILDGLSPEQDGAHPSLHYSTMI
jgi:transposase